LFLCTLEHDICSLYWSLTTEQIFSDTCQDSPSFYLHTAAVCPPVSSLWHYCHSGTSISACASKHYHFQHLYSVPIMHLSSSVYLTDSYSPFLESIFDWNLTKQVKDEISTKYLILRLCTFHFEKGEQMCVCYAFLSLTIKKDIAAVIKVSNGWTWQI